jgi:hypothetical protein
MLNKCQYRKTPPYLPDRKGLIKIISTRYFLVIKEIKKISSRYDFDQYFRSGTLLSQRIISALAEINENIIYVHIYTYIPKYQDAFSNCFYPRAKL